MPFDPRSLDGTTWLCEPSYVRRAVQRLAAMPTCPTARQLVKARKKRLEVAKQASVNAVRATKGRVGVIPILGPVQPRMTAEMEKLGGTSLEEVSLAFDMLMADASVSTILFEIDSPGGESGGVQELSDKIFAARGTKRIYAHADLMACSAAYWIATAAERLLVSKSSEVGSVGVYSIHYDESAALEQEGLSVTMISAGKFKTEFNSFEPLSDTARQALQEQVNATYDEFLGALKTNRGVSLDEVRKSFGQGRVVNSKQAIAAKMADKFRADQPFVTFAELLGMLTGRPGSSGGRTSAEVLRLRHEQQKARALFF